MDMQNAIISHYNVSIDQWFDAHLYSLVIIFRHHKLIKFRILCMPLLMKAYDEKFQRAKHLRHPRNKSFSVLR